MKIKNITDIDGFFKVIDSCQGKVGTHYRRGGQTEPQVKALSVCITYQYFKDGCGDSGA